MKDCIILKNRTHRSSEITTPLEAKYSHRPKRNRHTVRAKFAIEGVQVVRELFERGIRVHILNMGLVENTLTGNLILTVMLAFAEYERGTIVERTQTGKAVARQDPNFRDGRPKKFTPEQIDLALSLLDQGKTYRQITTMTGISKSTLIRSRRKSEGT